MGGVAVVYRHAAGLARRGHHVTVAAPRRASGVAGWLRSVAVWGRDRLHGVGTEPYYRAGRVETREPRSPGGLDVSNVDAVIATGHQTAPWVKDLLSAWRGGREKRAGLYFIQHDERYLSPMAEDTWHLGLTNVPVSGWIADVLQGHGAPVEGTVPNAVDPLVFALDRPVSGREARVIALYHRLPVKGPDVLVAALERLRSLVPDVRADVISARPPRHQIPSWVDVHVRPRPSHLRDLYNRAAVCLHTARLEGWGLVPMEAASCGCAVVATASRGPAEYLRAGRSYVEVPVGDGIAVAEAAADLLGDPTRRCTLAEAALSDVARFSWDDSTSRFESIIRRAVDP